MKVKECYKKFKIVEFKVSYDGDVEYIESVFNKSLMFEDDEIKDEVVRLAEEFADELNKILLD